MNTYIKKFRTFEETMYTTTYQITTFVQISENNRTGEIKHRYGRIVHSHYDCSLLGFPARWINERIRYYEWRSGYPY